LSLMSDDYHSFQVTTHFHCAHVRTLVTLCIHVLFGKPVSQIPSSWDYSC